MASEVRVLLVDDNPGDVELVRTTLSECWTEVRLQVARDGVEALSLLLQGLAEGPRQLPDFILLDLNMPRKNGLEVLADVRCEPRLSQIPIIVMSTSNSPEDVQASYRAGANCYVAKPMDIDGYHRVLSAIEQFWLKVAILPSRAGQR